MAPPSLSNYPRTIFTRASNWTTLTFLKFISTMPFHEAVAVQKWILGCFRWYVYMCVSACVRSWDTVTIRIWWLSFFVANFLGSISHVGFWLGAKPQWMVCNWQSCSYQDNARLSPSLSCPRSSCTEFFRCCRNPHQNQNHLQSAVKSV